MKPLIAFHRQEDKSVTSIHPPKKKMQLHMTSAHWLDYLIRAGIMSCRNSCTMKKHIQGSTYTNQLGGGNGDGLFSFMLNATNFFNLNVRFISFFVLFNLLDF